MSHDQELCRGHAMAGRIPLIGGAVIALAACASPARLDHMVATADTAAGEPNSSIAGAICISQVTGGEETDPLWFSQVDNAAFRDALQQSLRNNRLAAANTDGCRYDLEVNLLGLAQPTMGVDMEVTSHVNYSVLERASGEPYFLTTVTAAYTADFGSAFLGVDRLRNASEGAVRQNIQQFISELLAYAPPAPPVDAQEAQPPAT